MTDKIYDMIDHGWLLCVEKVAGGLINPENEKMLQLHLALIYQSLAYLYQFNSSESINVLLEVPVHPRENKGNLIDIVIQYKVNNEICLYPIELKCFRLLARGKKTKRGAGNLSMYDYWEDIENIELYSRIKDFKKGTQLTLTDDKYFVESNHKGSQVNVFSTSKTGASVTGVLSHKIANRSGTIHLNGCYDMTRWKKCGNFYSISQRSN